MAGPGDGNSIDKMAGGSNNRGSKFIDTAAVTWGDFEYLVVNADCVFTTLTTDVGRDCLLGHLAEGSFQPGESESDGLNLAGQTVAKGMVIYPPNEELFKDVTLSSGSVLAYG